MHDVNLHKAQSRKKNSQIFHVEYPPVSRRIPLIIFCFVLDQATIESQTNKSPCKLVFQDVKAKVGINILAGLVV